MRSAELLKQFGLEGSGIEGLILDERTRWTRPEHSVLDIVLRWLGCEPFSEAALLQHASSDVSSAELRVGLQLLCRKTILFSIRGGYKERLYILPVDTLIALVPIRWEAAAHELRMTGEFKEVGELANTSGPGGSLRDALLSLLCGIRRRKPKLTARGTLGKKDIEALTALLPLEEAGMEGISAAAHPLYPKPLAITLMCAERLELIGVCDGERRLVVHDAHATEWFRRKPAEMDHQLQTLLLSICGQGELLLLQAAALLLSAPEESELDADVLLQALLIIGGNVQGDAKKRIERELLEPWAAFGWLAPGQRREGRSTYRMTRGAISERAGGCYVQPDFEVIVPPDVDYVSRWHIDRFCEPVRTDAAAIYKLTCSSFQAGLPGWMEPSSPIEAIRACSLFGIPDQIERALEEWLQLAGQVVLRRELLLRCASQETADRIGAHPKLAPLLGERLGSCYAVEENLEESLRELLTKEGFGSNVRGLEDWCNKETMTLLPPTRSLPEYRYERELPEIEELYPELSVIPGIWWGGLKAYHRSTRRTIMQQAIDWGTPVELRLNGDLLRFVPKRITDDDSGWVVTGRTRAGEGVLHARDWEEMQLILPGINDK